MTTELLTERSVVTLRDRAIAAANEEHAKWTVEKAERSKSELARKADVLRIALRDRLGIIDGVTVIEHVNTHRDFEILEVRATVEDLMFSIRSDDDFGRPSVLVPCSRNCGKDLWQQVDSLEDLGGELLRDHEHHFACLQKFGDDGEPTTDRDGNPLGPFSDRPVVSSPWQRANDRVVSIQEAGARCAEAHARVMELEDSRALIKPEAIKRIMEQGLASSNSAAEKIVEIDPFYAEHRVKQRDAETERWAALAAYEAAKLTARLAIESFVVEERNR